jgi:hypothetical protein
VLKPLFNKKEEKINVELFEKLNNKSRYMATFTSFGLRYKDLVEAKKIHPWRNWYTEKEYEIFPGKKLKGKCLQKSLYD